MSDSAGHRARQTIRVYRPNNRLDESAVDAVKHLAKEVWRHRAHVALIFKRDFRLAYKGTTLGVVWNFILPLLPVSIYIFLSVFGGLPIEHLPRAVYVSFNVTLWMLFSGLIEQPISVIMLRNNEAMKTSLPISVAIASNFARLAFDTGVRCFLLAAVCIYYAVPPSILSPLALIVVVIGVVFSLSLGLMAAILNIVVPDTQSIVSVFMRYGIFISGVIFPLSELGPVGWIEAVNPLAILIHAAREITFTGQLSDPVPLGIVSVATVLVGLLAARMFYMMEYRIRGVV